MGQNSIKNHIALVVGAGRGVGQAIALKLAEQQVNLGLMARTASQLENTASLCRQKGGQAQTIPVDVTQSTALADAFNHFVDQQGGLDILVLCQAILYRSNLASDQQDQWRQVMETNLLSHMHLTRMALPYLLKEPNNQRKRAIIYISSIAGKQASAGISAYCASKFGLLGLAYSIFEEVRESGLKVSVICPGYINTDMVSAETHLNRDKMIQSEDIAEVVNQVIHTANTYCPVEIVVKPQRSPLK
jgi:3-oxoacyl-[acyl-carrier protein] reductase